MSANWQEDYQDGYPDHQVANLHEGAWHISFTAKPPYEKAKTQNQQEKECIDCIHRFSFVR